MASAAAGQAVHGMSDNVWRSVHGKAVQEYYYRSIRLLSKSVMCKLTATSDKRAFRIKSTVSDVKIVSQCKTRHCLSAPTKRSNPGCRDRSREYSIKAAIGVFGSCQAQENRAAMSRSERCAEYGYFPKSNPRTKQIDRWLQKFACEIVKSITEAPVIHLLFDTEEGSNARTERQKVWREDLDMLSPWSRIKESFSHRAPDGLIFVQRLHCEPVAECCWTDASTGCVEEGKPINDETKISTDIFGILVLGRSLTRSACYILKTTRVRSRFGICTSFFLTRAKCFGASLQEQLDSAWLVDEDRYSPSHQPSSKTRL